MGTNIFTQVSTVQQMFIHEMSPYEYSQEPLF